MPDLEVPPYPEDHRVDEDSRLVYYRLFFPFKHFFQWLNHAPTTTDDFNHRELAFTLQNDAYLRYQSYQSAEAFGKDVVAKNPKRWEIGPVYTANPRDRKSLRKNAFKPLSKELVFDIDLTDYDEIRTCCSDKKICEKCWKFITLAIKIMSRALTQDFGFKHIMWVYSGRRGAHAWVCDKRARDMDDSKRRAVAAYLQLIGAKVNGQSLNTSRPWHPHVQQSFDLLNKHFNQVILEDQDPWRTEDGAKNLLDAINDRNIVRELRSMWEQMPERSSAERWKDVDSVVKKGVSKQFNGKANKEKKQDIVLEYMYPRLDINVSRHLNHLLKSPFCIHPDTGRVCVPIDPADVDSFDPMAVPTVNMLIQEVESYDTDKMDVDNSPTKKKAPYSKTSLNPYMETFKKFVGELLRDELHGKRQRDSDKVDLEF